MKEFPKIPREKTENVILSRPTREGNLETTRLRVLQTPSRGIIHRRRTEVTEKKRPKKRPRKATSPDDDASTTSFVFPGVGTSSRILPTRHFRNERKILKKTRTTYLSWVACAEEARTQSCHNDASLPTRRVCVCVRGRLANKERPDPQKPFPRSQSRNLLFTSQG